MIRLITKTSLAFTIFLLSFSALFAQDPARTDSLQPRIGHTVNQYASSQDPAFLHSKGRQVVNAFILPLGLTGAAMLTANRRYAVRDWRNQQFPHFKTMSDDAIQYTPMLTVYALNIFGVRGRNDVANETAIMLKSAVVVTAMWFALKYSRPPEFRPDNTNTNSFPSGHTQQAFAAATFLHKEYGHKSVWYTIGGYTIATGVGAMRILNNKHWLPDVLIGAATGVLAVNLVYMTHQYHWGKNYRNKKRNQVLLLPTYGKGPGMYFCLKLK